MPLLSRGSGGDDDLVESLSCRLRLRCSVLCLESALLLFVEVVYSCWLGLEEGCGVVGAVDVDVGGAKMAGKLAANSAVKSCGEVVVVCCGSGG